MNRQIAPHIRYEKLVQIERASDGIVTFARPTARSLFRGASHCQTHPILSRSSVGRWSVATLLPRPGYVTPGLSCSIVVIVFLPRGNRSLRIARGLEPRRVVLFSLLNFSPDDTSRSCPPSTRFKEPSLRGTMCCLDLNIGPSTPPSSVRL